MGRSPRDLTGIVGGQPEILDDVRIVPCVPHKITARQDVRNGQCPEYGRLAVLSLRRAVCRLHFGFGLFQTKTAGIRIVFVASYAGVIVVVTVFPIVPPDQEPFRRGRSSWCSLALVPEDRQPPLGVRGLGPRLAPVRGRRAGWAERPPKQ